jgi:hypothetical protein
MRWRTVAAVIALIASTAAIAFVFVFVSTDEPIAPSILEPAPQRTPAFSFAVGRSGALPTSAIKARKPVRTDPLLRLHGASKIASRSAIASVTRLYRGAFLDPDNWQSGTYEPLWRDFARTAKPQARKDVRVLTAGAAAGDAYVAIAPRPSRITTTVLLDRTGKPAMVLASARFRAFGRRIEGSSNTRFDSSGRFFFERVAGSWLIVSYDVRRSDDKLDELSRSSLSSPAMEAP